MFHVTTVYCRRCNQRYTGQRVICIECMKRPDTAEYLLEQAYLATRVYDDMVTTLDAPLLQRWEAVLTAAADVDTAPMYQQTSAAVTLRKRLELTAQTPDLFGLLTQTYIQYRERCEDVDLYARLLEIINHEAAAQFHHVRENYRRK